MVMPRQPRLDAPGTLHHVMARGIEGRKVFKSRTDREDFLARNEEGVRSQQLTRSGNRIRRC